MKYWLKIPLLMLFLSWQTCFALPSALEIAKTQLGVRETGNNSGKQVNQYLRSVHLGPGYPWCAAFVRWCMDSAKVRYKTRSARARAYISDNSVPSSRVLLGYRVKPGSLVIWQRGNTQYGHIGFVERWDKNSGQTIEGNTSSGSAGSQYNGNGVYQRNRAINLYSSFRITHFTPIP